MKMPGHTGTSRCPLVDAEVDSIGIEHLLHEIDTPLDE